MRTLSARILLGFVALTIAVVVFAGTIVVNLREVEDEASLVMRGYVPLAIASNDLAQHQRDLKEYLDAGIQDAVRPAEITSAIGKLRKRRQQALDEIVKTMESVGSMVNSDGRAALDVARLLPVTTPMVEDLQRLVAEVAPLYATLLAAPPLRPRDEVVDEPHRRAFEALPAAPARR
jgi:hypothetical protein